jgi:hypothetical protein
VVRKERFELSRSCERQPLKLVRLPVPPLSLRREGPAEAGLYYFFSGAGVDGAGVAGAGALVVGAGPATPRISEPGP